jgi:hypothetical protein
MLVPMAVAPRLEASEPSVSYSLQIVRDSPAAYWDFQTAGPKKAVPNRMSAQSLTGALQGKASFGDAGPRPAEFPNMDAQNQALELGGGKDMLRVKDPGENSPLDFASGDAMTIEAWVLPRDIGENQYAVIVSKGRTGNPGFQADNLNYALRLKGHSGQAHLNFLYRSASPSPDPKAKANFHRWTSQAGFPVDDQWHHVAVTYTFGTKGSLSAYVDGKAVSGDWDMEGDTGAAPWVDDDELWIGNGMANNSGAFQGWLDEVAIHRSALPREKLASRYARSPSFPSRSNQGPPIPTALPDDCVSITVFEGQLDRSWVWRDREATIQFDWPCMALTQLPHHYNERGVIADRRLPLRVQMVTQRPFEAGRYAFLVRSRNAVRFWIDDRMLVQHPFLTTNGDGHEEVPVLPDPPQKGLHPLPLAHLEQVVEVDLPAGNHVIRLEAVVGGRTLRPETGELCVAMAPVLEQPEPLMVVTPDRGAPWHPDEEAWQGFLRDQSRWMEQLNQQSRRKAADSQAPYWSVRREAARQSVRDRRGSIDFSNSSIDAILGTPSDQAVIDDYAFLRRLSLDTRGVAPNPQELMQFVDDRSPMKRDAAIQRMLSDRAWADHWVGYWQDVLAENPGIVKPELNNTGPFRYWIHESFLDNKPFDRLVTELVMMEGSKFFGGPAGFAMASQNDAPMAAKAQILTKAFLGMDMACARCHDSPINEFSQKDLFSMAAMLHRGPLDLPKSSTVTPPPDGRTPLVTSALKAGDSIAPDWHLASFAPVDVQSQWLRDAQDQRERLALTMTSPNNLRFAQVIVNRLWHRYLGWELVAPLDQWDPSSQPKVPLLDYLADQLLVNGYDLKYIARLILSSRAYQAKAIDASLIKSARERPRLPTAPARRRLTSEQIVDSMFHACGKPMRIEPMSLDPEGRRPPEQFLHLGFPERAWQIASTSTDRDRPALIMPAVQQVADVLTAFGWRDARPSPITLRDESPGPMQSMVLGNGLSATRIARLSDDSRFTEIAWLASSPGELVEQWFRAILSRPPDDHERTTLARILEPGFENRRLETPIEAPRPKSHERNAVSWANHLVPEATRIKLEWEQEVLRGDLPTGRLESDWRERAEDVVWSLLNSPEFVFVP